MHRKQKHVEILQKKYYCQFVIKVIVCYSKKNWSGAVFCQSVEIYTKTHFTFELVNLNHRIGKLGLTLDALA